MVLLFFSPIIIMNTKANQIKEIDLKDAKAWGKATRMGNGLILTNKIDCSTLSQGIFRFNFILMALCCQGEAQYRKDKHKQTVKAGHLFFISQRNIVDEFTATPDFECQCIMVSPNFYHDFVQDVKNVSSLLLFSMNYPVVELTTREIEVYGNYYKVIKEKMTDARHYYRTQLVKALLLSMFYDMSNVICRVGEGAPQKVRRSDAIFTEFIHLLEKHYRTQRRVYWYAQQLDITPKHLTDLVISVSKRSPNQWIDDYVVMEIRLLLKNTTKTIREIADELHFADQSLMGKYFKKNVGVSPNEYRKG